MAAEQKNKDAKPPGAKVCLTGAAYLDRLMEEALVWWERRPDGWIDTDGGGREEDGERAAAPTDA